MSLPTCVLAFMNAGHISNVLAEQLLQTPMKTTVTSLFTGEETGLREGRGPLQGDPAGKWGPRI